MSESEHPTRPEKAATLVGPFAEGRTILLTEIQDALTRACATRHRPRAIVNVTGPLGVGKTSLLGIWTETAGRQHWDHRSRVFDFADNVAVQELPQALAACAPVPIDTVDTGDAASTLSRLITAAGRECAPVLAASRRPLQSYPGWAGHIPVITVPARPWPQTAIRLLAAELAVREPAEVELTVQLSGGIPLIADLLSRSLHVAGPVVVPGALADTAAGEILARLNRECGPHFESAILSLLSSIGQGDEEMLEQLGSLGAEAFSALSALSIVAPAQHGLAVQEPYRTLFELAYQWRRPVAHRTVITKAAARARILLETTDDNTTHTALALQSMFLTGDPVIRERLFPFTAEPPRTSAMLPDDVGQVCRLVHDWIRRGNLHRRNCQAMLDAWVTQSPDGFVVSRNRDGAVTGFVNLVPVNARTLPTLEPLLQAHTERLAESTDTIERGNEAVFAGLFIHDEAEPAEYAALLHHTLAASIERGRLLIATPWPEFEMLSRRLGFTNHGETTHDVYACGRQSQIFSQDFDSQNLPRWFDTLSAPSPAVQDQRRLIALVRHALIHFNDPAALASNPLCALPKVDGPQRLRTLLTEGVQHLTASPLPARAEAGQVLAQCYLHRIKAAPDVIAQRLCLSRATYFRRMNDGLTALVHWLCAADETGPLRDSVAGCDDFILFQRDEVEGTKTSDTG